MMLREDAQIRGTERVRQGDSVQAEQIRRGDQAAFRALFQTHYEALCHYACRYVESLEVAEDLVQDVFLDLWRRRDSWRPRHSPRAFLYGAVRNQTLNHRRRTRAFVEDEDAPGRLRSLDDPDAVYANRELARETQRAVDELSPRCRQVFILSREYDLTFAEIACALGISVKTVKTYAGRALQHLRTRLFSHRSTLRS